MLLIIRKENLVHLSEAGPSLLYNILSNHTTRSIRAQVTYSWAAWLPLVTGRRSFFTTNCLLLQRAKGLGDVWFKTEDRKGFHSCWKRQFKCRKQIHMQDKSSSNEIQSHTNHTLNKACTETFIHELCCLLVKHLSASRKVTQLGSRTRLRCLEHGLSHLPICKIRGKAGACITVAHTTVSAGSPVIR